MATQWWREPWRKLYTKLDAKWLGLSLSARGLADELIKYADEQGRLFEAADAIGAGKEIALRLSAKPREYKRISEDTTDLLKDTYLVIDEGWLRIRNFDLAQERLSPAARRKRKERAKADAERDDDEIEERDTGRDLSRDQNVTAACDISRDTNRYETNRTEQKPSLSPSAPVRVMGHDEQAHWLAAWEAADLPGHPLLVSVVAEWRRTPERQRPTPEAACLAYKATVDRLRADGMRAHVGAEHMLRGWGDIVDAARGAIAAPSPKKTGGADPKRGQVPVASGFDFSGDGS